MTILSTVERYRLRIFFVLFPVSLFLLVPVLIWAGYTTNVYLTNTRSFPRAPDTVTALSLRERPPLLSPHGPTPQHGASRTAARIYLGKSRVNIISAVTHLPSLPVFKTHWSLSPVKYGVALNVGSGKIIRLTEMNNWCVCRNTSRFLIIIVES